MSHLFARHEQLSPTFHKFYMEGADGHHVWHRFDAPDNGDPHDHPFDFRSYVVSGGYTEQVFDLATGKSEFITHLPGEAFFIKAGHIHRVVELLNGWRAETLITPIGEPQRKPGFYQFRDDGVYHRFHDEPEFRRI